VQTPAKIQGAGSAEIRTKDVPRQLQTLAAGTSQSRGPIIREVVMEWKGRRQSSNVEDRRGSGGGRLGGGGMRIPIGMGRGGMRAGGGGIGMIIAVLVISWFLGINPLTLLGGLDGSGGSVSYGPLEEQRPRTGTNDELSGFVKVVLADTEDTWNKVFSAQGQEYPAPTLVLFSGQAQSGCGFASSASGPFYCPTDQKVYIDLQFYEELRRRFQAPGDFAQAYVIAHEVGHHVQNIIGVLPEFNRRRQAMSEEEANALSVRVELQADCFAGVWAADAQRKGVLEPGDIDEALNAATQIGDDAIQKRTQGYVVPESFNHGTSEQRRRWFAQGFEGGTIDGCDTFTPANV
jgi:predicted metalloprotease